MEIRPFVPDDVPLFLSLAAAEGWISDPWEFAFLLDTFPFGCLAVEEEGRPVAFVAAVRYGTSGWIGNLVVAKDVRGRGLGTRLMQRAVDKLLAAGVKTVWLTASEAGRPLYEKLGFREMDGVVRWHGMARGGGENDRDPVCPDELVPLDGAGWGDDRGALLAAVAARGTVLREEGGFLVVQPCGDDFQIGPWAAVDRRVAAGLLGRALTRLRSGARVLLDVPVRNVAAAALLNGTGFTVGGRTVLMCVGAVPAYAPEIIFASATMGSMG
ncbi:hypothetical protein BURK2_04118 [Burkholderiales bacterium]|nr:hypothetical protein BURK2_04118 [Burkholderiales bacterium]